MKFQRLILLFFYFIFLGNGSSALFGQINVERMTIIGRNAIYFEDYILGINYFNQIIKAKPYLSEPYFFRATGKFYLEDYKGAEIDCNSAIELNPYFADVYHLRGLIYLRQERFDEAVSDFKRGFEIEPNNSNFLINMGVAHTNKKEYNNAVDAYSEAINLSPKLILAWLNRAYSKMALNDTIGGLNDFSKVVSLNPYIPDGYVGRGAVYYQIGDYEKSLEDMNKTIELRPEEANYYLNRGIVRYQLDDLRGTMADFDKVIELDSRNVLAYSNRGILRAQVGDINRAIDDFSRVLALQRTDYLTLYNRALLYIQTGELENALNDLNIIAAEYPDFKDVYFNRSQVKSMLGDRRGAELDYGTAVKLEMERRAEDEKLALNDKDKDDAGTTERKQTRKESDKDIANYDKIAVLDDFASDEPEQLHSSALRGKIQNRNITIDMQPAFVMSYFPGDTLVHRLRYYNKDIDVINKKSDINNILTLANNEIELSRDEIVEVFSMIKGLNEEIEKDKENYTALFSRAILYNSVSNLNNSLDDFSKLIEIDGNNYLAWFGRAIVRIKMVELMKSLEGEEVPAQPLMTGTNSFSNTTSKIGEESSKERRILDYEAIIFDLQKCAEAKPNFEFAPYNIGVIYSYLRDFTEAKKYFTKAIELNEEFAEAWFNRGLINIFLGEDEKGTVDLSKAGELGVYDAYSVIKRYGEKPDK